MFDNLRLIHCKRTWSRVITTLHYSYGHDHCTLSVWSRKKGETQEGQEEESGKDWGDRQRETKEELGRSARLTRTTFHFDLQMNNPCTNQNTSISQTLKQTKLKHRKKECLLSLCCNRALHNAWTSTLKITASGSALEDCHSVQIQQREKVKYSNVHIFMTWKVIRRYSVRKFALFFHKIFRFG